MESTSNIAKPFRILDLPPEIRIKIYVLLCTSSTPYISLSSVASPLADPSFPHDLLLTNTQLYHELRPLYFSLNSFSLTVRRGNDDWSYFRALPFRDNRRQIRSLRIVVLRWGTKDFFCQSLVPVLEDCVMNGRLRNLEVMVREGFLKGLGHGGGEGFENWARLKTLLTDPYLESAKLLAGTVMDGGGEASGIVLTKLRDVTELLAIGK